MTKIESMVHLQFRFLYIIFFLTGTITLLHGQKLNHVQGEFIVQVNDEKDLNIFRKQLSSSRAKRTFDGFSAKQIMKEPLNLWVLKIDFTSVNELEFERQIRAFGKFDNVQKNRLIRPRIIPNDPDFNKQWQYINTGSTGGIEGADMDMELAWDITTGGLTPSGDTIVVCVIDDGINANHEDIKDNLWINYNEIPSNGIDDDNNGYIDDYKGWNVEFDDDNVYAGGTHGTPVAGIIGAKGNNGKGVSGVNWNVKLMIVDYHKETEANALASYGYAYKMRKLYNESNGNKGAFVVATNASWGIDYAQANEAPLWCAMYDVLGQVGILNCGATTNSNTDVDVLGDLPTSCASEYLISVTNLNKSDFKVANAGFGRKTIDLGAYGHQSYTVTRTAYGGFSGTSGATPHVTGMIGLLYSAPCGVFQNLVSSDPAAAALVAKDMIFHGTVPNASLEGITTTGGKLNAFRSLSNLLKLCETCSPPAGITLLADDLSMKISWISDHGSSKITMRYRRTDQNSWIEVKNPGNNKIITGLDYCSEYEVQLGSDCGLLPGEYSYSKFIKTAGCCNIPIVENIVSGDSTITLVWKKTDEANYFVEYKNDKNEWRDTILTEPTFTIRNIPECTGYTFRLKAACSKYNNSSEFSSEITASSNCGKCTENEYCIFESKDASQEWIESFTLDGVTIISGSSVSGYRDFAGLETFSLSAGKAYPFKIRALYGGTSYPDFYKIYIDYNQDGIWTQNEMAFKTPFEIKDSISDMVIIPLDAINGFTRLRLIMSYEDFDGACDDSEFEYGEVEDYCVFIKNDVCRNNVILQIGTVEKSKIVFTTLTSSNINISIREKGSDLWTEINAEDTIVVNGLKECTLYEYTYKVKCGDKYSEPSIIDTVKTACQNNITELESQVRIVPNPASDLINIYSPSNVISFSEYKLTNISGLVVIRNTSKLTAENTKIETRGLPSGLYLLELISTNGIKIVKKIVII